MVQDRKRIMDQVQGDSVGKLKVEISKVVADIAKEKNIAIVLTQETVVLARPELNITEEVIKRLNAAVKSIPVDWAKAK